MMFLTATLRPSVGIELRLPLDVGIRAKKQFQAVTLRFSKLS